MKQKLRQNNYWRAYYSLPTKGAEFVVCVKFVSQFINAPAKHIEAELFYKNPKKKGFKKVSLIRVRDGYYRVYINGKIFSDETSRHGASHEDHYHHIFEWSENMIQTDKVFWLRFTNA